MKLNAENMNGRLHRYMEKGSIVGKGILRLQTAGETLRRRVILFFQAFKQHTSPKIRHHRDKYI